MPPLGAAGYGDCIESGGTCRREIIPFWLRPYLIKLFSYPFSALLLIQFICYLYNLWQQGVTDAKASKIWHSRFVLFFCLARYHQATVHTVGLPGFHNTLEVGPFDILGRGRWWMVSWCLFLFPVHAAVLVGTDRWSPVFAFNYGWIKTHKIIDGCPILFGEHSVRYSGSGGIESRQA